MKKSLQTLLSVILVIVASFGIAISPVNAQVLIDASQKSGALIVQATENINLPYLTNTSNNPITVKIQAEGKWNFGPGDVFGKLVDANGNPDFAGVPNDMRFPSFNAATLVALKNNQPVAGGKEQTIELLPGETVSFINNDAANRYSDNSGFQVIKYSVSSPTPACPNRITVNGKNYSLELLGGTYNDNVAKIKSSPWWGNENLAREVAKASNLKGWIVWNYDRSANTYVKDINAYYSIRFVVKSNRNPSGYQDTAAVETDKPTNYGDADGWLVGSLCEQPS